VTVVFVIIVVIVALHVIVIQQIIILRSRTFSMRRVLASYNSLVTTTLRSQSFGVLKINIRLKDCDTKNQRQNYNDTRSKFEGRHHDESMRIAKRYQGPGIQLYMVGVWQTRIEKSSSKIGSIQHCILVSMRFIQESVIGSWSRVVERCVWYGTYKT
jgi:hypothetical protein